MGHIIVTIAASTTRFKEKELNQTPTWVVETICAIIILVSTLLAKNLHKLGVLLHLHMLLI